MSIFFKKNIRFFSQHIMNENQRPEEEKIIEGVGNLFRLEKLRKETINTTIKDIKKMFRQEKRKKKSKAGYLEI